MTTLKSLPDLNNFDLVDYPSAAPARTSAPAFLTGLVSRHDFVSSDTAALASHMNRCASTRGRFFKLQAAMESAHSMVSARLVTFGAVAVVLMVLVAAV